MSAVADSFLPPVATSPPGAEEQRPPARDGDLPARRLGAAVLGPRGSVDAIAAAAAVELRRRHGVRAATVLVWGDRGGADAAELSLPATGSARSLTDRLRGSGLAASPRGRLAWVVLDDDPALAAHECERALATVPEPVVLAIGEARPAALEVVLAAAERVLLVSASPADEREAMLRLAADSLSAGSELIATTPLGGWVRRRAQAGWGSGGRLLPGPAAP